MRGHEEANEVSMVAHRRGELEITEDPITPNNRCKHRFVGVRTIVIARAEGGHAARCLLCDAVGPVRANGEDARRALSNRTVRDEEQ